MSNKTFRLIVFSIILATLFLVQGFSTPVAAQGCTTTDPASGRVIPAPCPPEPKQESPQQRQGQAESGPVVPQLNPPKVGELCTDKPTIEFFKASQVDYPQKGPGLVFEWKVRDTKYLFLEFVDSPAYLGVYDLDLNGKWGALLSKFTGMKSATLHASCPPYEVVATINPDPEWFSNSNTNSEPIKPGAANLPNTQPLGQGSSQTLYSDPDPDFLKLALAGMICLGLSAAFMTTAGGLGLAKKLLDDPSMKWLKDFLCTTFPHTKVFGCDDSE